jgi:hypothetical protein
VVQHVASLMLVLDERFAIFDWQQSDLIPFDSRQAILLTHWFMKDCYVY